MAEGRRIICDDKDREYLRKIRKEYKNLVRNIWNPLIEVLRNLRLHNCKQIIYNAYWRCFICPYVHIKIGNIFKQSLKEIVDFGSE